MPLIRSIVWNEFQNSTVEFWEICAIIAPCRYYVDKMAQSFVLENKEYLNAES
jgi:hypothetical protein